MYVQHSHRVSSETSDEVGHSPNLASLNSSTDAGGAISRSIGSSSPIYGSAQTQNDMNAGLSGFSKFRTPNERERERFSCFMFQISGWNRVLGLVRQSCWVGF